MIHLLLLGPDGARVTGEEHADANRESQEAGRLR
jgi:hypothetical protein